MTSLTFLAYNAKMGQQTLPGKQKKKKEILLFFSVCQLKNICFPWRSGVVSTH